MKIRKVDFLILGGGGASISLALTMILDIGFCSRYDDFCWDWGEYHFEMGLLLLFVGLFMFIMAFRKGQRDYAEVFICPQCETALPFAEVPGEICPKCHTKLESLEGFYERHPELKEK